MLTIVIVSLLLILVGVWVYERLPRWRSARAHAPREPLTEAQFGERFFTAELSPIAARLRRIASEQLGNDLSQLRPEDRLAPILSDPFDSLDSVELLMANQLEQSVRDIVLTQLSLPPERYQAQGRFIEDFGLEVGLGRL